MKKELTVSSIVAGVLLSIVFGAANAYLGLRVGMTISASIPAAVIAMGVFRLLIRRNSKLESNMVQTIGSAGESLAGGAIFSLPVLFLWAAQTGQAPPSVFKIMLITLCGGLLGTLFMIPLRRTLVEKEHGKLPFPEGTACAQVIEAGVQSGARAVLVMKGMLFAAFYKFLTDGLKIFPSEVHYEFKSYKGGAVGIDVLPALAGVGYICGGRIAGYMISGGILSWLVLIPLIALFGAGEIIYPATDVIAKMDSFSIWSSYIRYIGAGAVAMAGFISLIKVLPMIISVFKETLAKTGDATGKEGSKDLPMRLVIFGIVAIILIIWVVPTIPINLFGAILIAIFGFFFATVSARMVGLVGSSNSPISGMTIATLLIAAFLLKSIGQTGMDGMITAIAIGSIICIVSAVAGDTSQDLKSGYLLGATPYKQQIGEMIGIFATSLAIGGILFLLDKAWGYGSSQLPAPQAMMMKMVVEGIMEGNLPWHLIFAGAGIAIVIEILGVPVLAFAVGMYLPIHLSAPIMVGGLLRHFMEKRRIKKEEKERQISNGVLFSSGMIAGEGLVGIFLAVLMIIPFRKDSLGNLIDISSRFDLSAVGSLVAFAFLLFLVFFFSSRRETKNQQ